ncbi:MAG TPA: hypothetical protein VEC99_01310 [Clostridia bacterium]|nr:hypothetical protein [Clostridia bacterium]
MSESQDISRVNRKRPWLTAILLLFTVGLTGLVLWFGDVFPVRQAPLFRGKPESEWIKDLKYSDDQQVKEWRGYGEEGVQVLIRGLRRVNHPGERAYRRLCRLLPVWLSQRLPVPKADLTRSTRHCIVSLLSSLGTDAKSAASLMVWTAGNDEADGVRQSAITYFDSNEGENCLLNQLPGSLKQALLPALIRSIQDPGNWGLRNNAAILLKHYAEQREIVAPVLVKALQDPQPQVRLLAAEALNRVAPDLAQKSGATATLVAITKHPDDQIAFRAVAALKGSGVQPDLAVPALIECLQSTNNLVACEAVWALEWAPKEFETYTNTFIPALASTSQREDNVGKYARAALARWKEKLWKEKLAGKPPAK